MSLLPRRVRNVNTRKIPRPSPVLPIALKRSSDFECRGPEGQRLACEICPRSPPENAMLLALGPVALIPVKSGYLHPALSRQPLLSVYFCTAIRQYLRLYGFRQNERVQCPLAASLTRQSPAT